MLKQPDQLNKLRVAKYKTFVWSRAIKKAWESFGKSATAIGVIVSVISYFALGGVESLISALVFIAFLLIAILWHAFREPAIIYSEQEQVIKSLEDKIKKFESGYVSENSFNITHFVAPSINCVEVKYINGNEPIKILSVKVDYINSNEVSEQVDVTHFFSNSDLNSSSHQNVSVVQNGDVFYFQPPTTYPNKSEVVVALLLYGVISEKELRFERSIILKPSEGWLIS